MNQNIKTFFLAFYETNKREFWLLIGSNIFLGFILNYYDLNGLVESAIIIVMALKNLSFLRSASVMPSVSSDFDRYSWKYFQGLPLNKEELIISLMLTNLFVMFPAVIWLMSFFIQIAGIFDTGRDTIDYLHQLKIFLCLIPVLFIISSMSLINLITFPRKQYSKNEPKAVFLHKIKVMTIGCTGVFYFVLVSIFFDNLTGIEISRYFSASVEFIYNQSTWWLVPVLVLVATANYFNAVAVWQNEIRSYKKIVWQPKRDLSILSLCVALVWVPINQLDLRTPEEYAEGKVVNAIYKKDFKKAKQLIDDGQDVNLANSYGITPLLTASGSKNLDMVRYLIDKGADLSTKSKTGSTVLINAIGSGNEEVTKFLLKQKGDFHQASGKFGRYPIHHATRECKPEMVDLLIEFKVDLNVQDKNGQTPLHIAAKSGCFGSVALLLDAGVKTDILDKEKNLAAYYASKSDSSQKGLDFYIEKRSRMPASK